MSQPKTRYLRLEVAGPRPLWALASVSLSLSAGCSGLLGESHSLGDNPAPETPLSSDADPSTPEPVTELDRAELEAALGREVPVLTPVGRLVLSAAEGQCGWSGIRFAPEPGHVVALADLIASGDVVPGNADGSPLVQRLARGEAQEGSPACTAGELALIRQFIDELAFEEQNPCLPTPFKSLSTLHAEMLADVQSAGPADRPFFRYFSLAYLGNSGACYRDIERERVALSEALNGLSLQPEIKGPLGIDVDSSLYRIDLRDYAWNRSIDLQTGYTEVFADAWLAIVDAMGDLAVEFTGEAADELARETGTRVPWLPVHAFISASLQGDLYYALLDNDSNLLDTQRRLGVDVVASAGAGDLSRAGVIRTSPALTIATRVPRRERAPSAYWMLEDNSEGMTNPATLAWSGGKLLYALPNGMQAYGVAAANGVRLAEFPLGTVGDLDEFIPQNAASCYDCHKAGLLPVLDDVRDLASARPEDFDSQTLGAIEAAYVPRSDFAALIASDSALHTSARARAGINPSWRDPVAEVYYRFEQPLNAARVAAELGVTRDLLLANLSGLPSSLAPLQSDSAVDRYALVGAYISALCTLHPPAETRPANCP